jgi:signal transduction histidine kinase
MIERLRARFAETALGPVAVIWGFGYVLVDILTVLLGRSGPGLIFFCSLPLLALGVALTLAIDRLRRAWHGPAAPLRWIALAPAVGAAAGLQAMADLVWLRWLARHLLPAWQSWAGTLTMQRFVIAFILYLWTFCLALTVNWAAGLIARAEADAARAERAEAEAERAEAEADEAEAEAERAEEAAERAMAMALRLQLNPHFLFNTLNSISSLVTLDRKAEAQAMLDALGAFLRASLHADPTADVTLAEELETIDAYLDIESIRFGDRLTIELDVAPGLSDLRVPNFILQPLVENAVKHGVARAPGPACLRISAARTPGGLMLSVTNSCDPEAATEGWVRDKTLPPGRRSTGIGLANIRQRLAIRYDDAARLETGPAADGWRAEIWLPDEDGRGPTTSPPGPMPERSLGTAR